MTQLGTKPPAQERAGGTKATKRLASSRRWLILAALGPYLVTSPSTSESTTDGSSALHAIQAGVLVAGVVLGCLRARPVRRLRWGAPELFLVLFLGWAVLSYLWSDGPAQTLLTAGSLALTYLALRLLVARYPSADEAMRGLAGFVHVLLVWTAVQAAALPDQAFRAVGFDPTRRLIGLYPTVGSNLLALLAVLGLVLLLLGLGPRWTHPPLLRSMLAVLYTAELLLTRTRSAWVIAAVVLLVAFVAACRRSPWPLIVGCFAVPVMALIGVWQWEAVSAFLLRNQSSESLSTLTGRTTAWQEGLAYWQTAPWTGHGYYAGHRVGLLQYRSETLTNLDNTWIEALVDVGIIGAVLLVAVFLTGAVRALRRSSGITRVWVLCVLLYGLLASFVNPSLQDTNVAQLLLAWCILAHASGRVRTPSSPSTSSLPAVQGRTGPRSAAPSAAPAFHPSPR